MNKTTLHSIQILARDNYVKYCQHSTKSILHSKMDNQVNYQRSETQETHDDYAYISESYFDLWR